VEEAVTVVAVFEALDVPVGVSVVMIGGAIGAAMVEAVVVAADPMS
jgi:hypothetical protein